LIRRWSPSWDGGKLTKGCCRKLKGDERWAVSGFLVCLLLLWLYMYLDLAVVKCLCTKPCLWSVWGSFYVA
jgi:hypothetical protein